MSDPKAKIDWEAIARAYRAGTLSIREIARQHDITDTYIRRRAKQDGWERDLTAQVAEKVRTALVRDTVRKDNARTDNPATEREIVESAAAMVVQVVREHRVGIARGRGIVALLMEQLADVALTRPEIEATIEEETKDDEFPDRRNKMLKAVALPTHAGIIKDLTVAMKALLPLERIAFNIGDEGAKPPVSELSEEQLRHKANELARELGLPEV